MHPGAGGVDQDRGGAVDHVAGGELAVAGLEQVFEPSALPLGDLAMDREDRPQRDVGFDVGRSIERIVQQHVVTAGELVRDGDRVVDLFRGHHAKVAGVIERLEHHLVGELVELADVLTVDVELAGAPQDVDQAGAIHLTTDDLGRERDVVKDVGKSAGRFRVSALLFDDVPAQRDDGSLYHSSLLGSAAGCSTLHAPWERGL